MRFIVDLCRKTVAAILYFPACVQVMPYYLVVAVVVVVLKHIVEEHNNGTRFEITNNIINQKKGPAPC